MAVLARKHRSLFFSSALVALVLTFFIFQKWYDYQQAAVIDRTVNGNAFRVATLDYGGGVFLGPAAMGIIHCRDGTAPGVTMLDPRAQIPLAGGEIYEYSEDYAHERAGVWDGRVAQRGAGTLTAYLPGRAYAAKVNALSYVQCSTPADPILPRDSITLNHGGWTRMALVHVPPSYNSNTDLPLLIALHGGGGSAEDSERTFHLNEVADREGFIVVYPQGTGSVVNGVIAGTWNAGYCCGVALTRQVDDVGFISAVIDRMIADYHIDATRVYATGHSNGAMMSYRLACQLSNRITAIAPVGGQTNPPVCSPPRDVPVFHIHGAQDPCSTYAGGTCGGCYNEFLQGLGLPVADGYTWACPSIPQQVSTWAGLNGCTQTTHSVATTNGATCIAYDNCGAPTELCTLPTLGHAWPGDEWGGPCYMYPTSSECNLWKQVIGGSMSPLFNAGDEMWKFFEPLHL